MIHQPLPLPWKTALLAVLPGLIATLGLIRADFSIWMLTGLGLLTTYLVIAYFSNQRQLPPWSFMALGMLCSIGVTILCGVLGGIVALLAGQSAQLIILSGLAIALLIFWRLFWQGRPVPARIWLLLALIFTCQLAVRIKYFVFVGVSCQVAGEWLSISFYAALVGLVLPAIVSAWLTQRSGPAANLFVFGGIYLGFQLLIDINNKVSAQIDENLAFGIYQMFLPVIFTIAAPLWFVRAPAPYRLGGLLLLSGLAMIINLVIVGLAYGNLPLIIWVSFIPYTISVLATLILANFWLPEHV